MNIFKEISEHIHTSKSLDISLNMFINDGGIGYPLSTVNDSPSTLPIPLYGSWPSNTILALLNGVSKKKLSIHCLVLKY
jgi:hypothetical protein